MTGPARAAKSGATPTALRLLVAAAALAGCLHLSDARGRWSYGGADGPDNWEGMCQGGMMQSPIDLGSSGIKLINFESFAFINYDKQFNGKITNNGHTVQINILDSPHNMFLTGGGLNSVYILGQIHFHWDSEHTVIGRRFPLEAHFVHYKSNYNSVSEAVEEKGGIAVVGVLFEEVAGYRAYSTFSEIKDIIKYERTKEITVKPQDFLPENTVPFFRYFGSLTTPTCDESVIWTVLENPLPISREQLKIFSTVQTSSGKNLTENYRPEQKLNNRVLYYQTHEPHDLPWINSANSAKYSATVISVVVLLTNILQ